MKKLLTLLLTFLTFTTYSQTDSWVKLDLQLDAWPWESTWELRDSNTDTIIAESGWYGDLQSELVELYIPLNSGTYTFQFIDEYGDGFYPEGYILLSNECQDTLSYAHDLGNNPDNGWTYTGSWTNDGEEENNTVAMLVDTLTIAPCAPPTTFVPGCMDPMALNYDELATVPSFGPYEGDTTCEYIWGCTDPGGLNYNPEATMNDDMCEWPSCSGFDTSNFFQACNGSQTELTFEWMTSGPGPNCDVNQLHYGYNLDTEPFIQSQFYQGDLPVGSTPPVTFPYTIWEVSYFNNNANSVSVKAGGNFATEDIPHFFFVKFQDGTYSDTLWITPQPCIVGCTDSESPLYNPFATIDDGSCQVVDTTCPEDEAAFTVILTPDTYAGEISWEVVDTLTENVVATSPPYNETGVPVATTVCVDPTMYLQFNLLDTYGDGMCGSCFGGVDGEVLIINPSCGDTLFHLAPPDMNFGYEISKTLGNIEECEVSGPLAGCTNPGFVEYDPMAVTDDGSCTTEVLLGCMNPLSFNYDPLANQQAITPECDYTLRLTDGAGDGWFGSYIGVVQGDSIYGPYTIYNGGQVDIPITLSAILPAKIYFFTQGNSITTANQCGVELINPVGMTTFSVGSNPWTDVMMTYPFVYTTIQQCGDNCIPVILGCLDTTAFNYNGSANTDDSSCYYTPGCTSPAYLEYHSQGFVSDFDDGSCITLGEFGCMDPTAFNYNEYATVQWTSATDSTNPCIPTILGCTDATAVNFIPLTGDPLVDVNTEDYTCISVINGCTDPEAFNYNEVANTDNGSCIAVVEGCTDSSALNYNSDANVENYTCIPFIYGCTDSTAFNYDQEANTDNGSCIAIVEGCTNTLAFNYNSEANVDDGTCILTVYGCMDDTALNYDEDANVDNETCIAIVEGCTDSTATNYNSDANVEDYSCIPFIYGCTDSTAFNYDSEANTDNDSCVPVVEGCTNTLSVNYNSEANTDDGSCELIVYGCMDETALNYNEEANVDNESCIEIVEGCTDPDALNYNSEANVEDFTCIAVVNGCMDSTALNYDEDANVDNGSCIPIVEGCTNPSAINYNADANLDDFSCVLPIYGCMDDTALNYDENANTDNGTCIAIVEGCTDPSATNYNSDANVDDFSCVPYIYGCTDETMFNYNPLANTDNDTCEEFAYGCTDSAAANFDPLANTNNNTCHYNPGCTDSDYLEFYTQGFTADFNNGSCLTLVVYGCTDNSMFNYDSSANFDNGSCVGFVYGCTDSTMFNYNPLANTNNGTCIPFIYGCMDPTMYNYDPDANTNQVSATDITNPCISIIYGCTDPTAFNYDADANTDNGTCEAVVYGCTDEYDFPNYLSTTYPDYLGGFGTVMTYNIDSDANTDDGSCLYYDLNSVTGAGTPYWLNDDCYSWVVYEVDPYCMTNQWDDFCQAQYDYCAEGTPIGLDDLRSEEILVYPNPTSDNIIVKTKKEVDMVLYDLIGNQLKVIKSMGETQIDLTNYSSGIYNLQLEYEGITINHKVIKQ